MSDQFDQIADDLQEAHSRLLALLATEPDSADCECTCEYEEPLTPEALRHDFPIFDQLDRIQLLRLVGAIALWLGDKAELLPRDWEELGIPRQAEEAIEQLSEEQLQQSLLPYLTSRLQGLPVPCGCCGGSLREPESGFCPECDRRFNTLAAYQVVGGGWEEDRDMEHSTEQTCHEKH